jgi:CheY-like chemotaxis protein
MSASGRHDKTERRGKPRAQVPARAHVFIQNRIHGHYGVGNLSASGALLVGDAPLDIGRDVRLVLHLGERRSLSIYAHVVRSEQAPRGPHAFAVTFRNLTAAIEDQLQRMVLARLESESSLGPPAVLVVDDSQEVCQTLARDLEALGRAAVAATTVAEAKDRLAATEARFYAALVDLMLGESDGAELLSFLADERPEVRRILMSGHVRASQLDLAVTSGRAHAVLHKPWQRDALAAVTSA